MAERPDVAELLTKPNWYFDRKGEVSTGLNGWVKKAVFYYFDGQLVTKFCSVQGTRSRANQNLLLQVSFHTMTPIS